MFRFRYICKISCTFSGTKVVTKNKIVYSLSKSSLSTTFVFKNNSRKMTIIKSHLRLSSWCFTYVYQIQQKTDTNFWHILTIYTGRCDNLAGLRILCDTKRVTFHSVLHKKMVHFLHYETVVRINIIFKITKQATTVTAMMKSTSDSYKGKCVENGL